MSRVLKPMIAFVALALGGCGPRGPDAPPTTAELVGTYRGRYGGGIERLEISADGSFTQVFRIGTNIRYNSKGTWQLLPTETVMFTPFMTPRVINGTVSDKKMSSGTGMWLRRPIRIQFGEWPYHVAKVSGAGATVKDDSQ